MSVHRDVQWCSAQRSCPVLEDVKQDFTQTHDSQLFVAWIKILRLHFVSRDGNPIYPGHSDRRLNLDRQTISFSVSPLGVAQLEGEAQSKLNQTRDVCVTRYHPEARIGQAAVGASALYPDE